MGVFEKKSYTNVYWNKKFQYTMTADIRSSEDAAVKAIRTEDEDLIFQCTIPCTIQYEIPDNLVLVKEKPAAPVG